MRRLLVVALVGLGLEAMAHAHDLAPLKLVNGQPSFDVSTYPTTLDFSFTVTNTNPTLPSTLLTTGDPLFEPIGWSYTPAPPLTLQVGESVTYHFPVIIKSFDECVVFGEKDDDPGTPGPLPDAVFTNVFKIGWDTGSAQSSVQVTCHQHNSFPCDNTVYVSHAVDVTGPTFLGVFDPGSGVLSELGSSPVSYNGIGFNQNDGLVYAIETPAAGAPVHIFRLGRDGTAQVLGDAIPELSGNWGWYTGAFLGDGTYFVAASRLGYGPVVKFAILDVTHADPTTAPTLVRMTDPSGTFEIYDAARNPMDGLLYAYDSVTLRLLKIDPVSFAATPFGGQGPLDPGGIAVDMSPFAAFFDAAGELFFFGRAPFVGSFQNDTFYKADLASAALSVVSHGPPSNFADGAACVPGTGSGPSLQPLRNLGFFMTHEAALGACLDDGALAFAGGDRLASVDDALALLWADSGFDSHDRPRAAVDSARLELEKRLVAAECSARLFARPDGAALAMARAALAGSSSAALGAAAARLDEWLRSGEAYALPPAFRPGEATPAHARDRAAASALAARL